MMDNKPNSTGDMAQSKSQPKGLAVWEKVVGLIFGILFLGAVLTITVLNPDPSPTQYVVYKVVLALAAGGVAAIFAGRLHLEGTLKKLTLRAGGALAVFVLVLWFTPEMPTEKDGGTTVSQTVESGGTGIAHTGEGDINVDLGGSDRKREEK